MSTARSVFLNPMKPRTNAYREISNRSLSGVFADLLARCSSTLCAGSTGRRRHYACAGFSKLIGGCGPDVAAGAIGVGDDLLDEVSGERDDAGGYVYPEPNR